MGGRKEDGVKYGKFSRGSSRVVIVCIAEEKNFIDMSKKLKDKLHDPVLQLKPWDHATYPSNFLTYLYNIQIWQICTAFLSSCESMSTKGTF